MILTGVLHISFRCIHFKHGVNAGLQVRDVDLAPGVSYAIQVMRAVLNPRNSEGRTSEAEAAVAIQLHQTEAGLLGVGEHELGIFVTVNLDDTSGVINQVAIRRGQLRHLVGTRLQIGQVDLAICVGGVLLGEGTADKLNTEPRVGQRLQGGAVQLYKMDTRLLIIEEDQLQNAIGAFQLNLLRCGIDDVRGVGSDFLYKVGAGFQIG